MNLTCDYEENVRLLHSLLPIDQSFDLIGREVKIANKKGYLVFVDGFAKDDMMFFTLNNLQSLSENFDASTDVATIIANHIPYIEAEPFTDLTKMVDSVLCGSVGLIIESLSSGIIIDAREYPARGPEEGDAEKITRGSKDGFVETIVFNTALIRRRIRDQKLVFSMKSVGTRSKTDVAICYIGDLVDPELLESIEQKIEAITIDTLVMAEKSLEELLIKKKWYNPLPQVKYTQRPDIVASYLVEGHVAVLVDTSPCAMILPTTLFYFSQYAEDYYQNPLLGTYNRFLRFCATLTTLFLIPVWLMLASNTEQLPEWLKFIGTKEESTISLLLQFLLLEFGFDLIKMSALHTPNFLGSAFGILGGLLLGEFAIRVGFFVPETIFYTALSAIALYCIPNEEFASAIRLFRLLILVSTGIFGIWGFGVSTLVVFLITATTETLDPNRKYLWPLIPFNGKALSNILFRKPVHRRQ